MSVSHKPQNQLAFRMMLYSRPLHPELFDLKARRSDRHGEYEAESWVIPAGHVVRFAIKGQQLSECVIDAGDHLPENGLVHALPCLGEKDFEMEPEGRLKYYTTVQSESLTDNLYQATYREMIEFAAETGSLSHAYATEAGQNLSVLDAQKYRREYHVQSYHLVATGGTVIRTQSIFEIQR